ncbi:hypothetical protein D3C87_868890 [compost metagenome]
MDLKSIALEIGKQLQSYIDLLIQTGNRSFPKVRDYLEYTEVPLINDIARVEELRKPIFENILKLLSNFETLRDQNDISDAISYLRRLLPSRDEYLNLMSNYLLSDGNPVYGKQIEYLNIILPGINLLLRQFDITLNPIISREVLKLRLDLISILETTIGFNQYQSGAQLSIPDRHFSEYELIVSYQEQISYVSTTRNPLTRTRYDLESNISKRTRYM